MVEKGILKKIYYIKSQSTGSDNIEEDKNSDIVSILSNLRYELKKTVSISYSKGNLNRIYNTANYELKMNRSKYFIKNYIVEGYQSRNEIRN